MKTSEEIRKLAINGLLAEKAQDDMGIYPAAIKGGPNAYDKRSDWQEGWNAAVMAYTNKLVAYEEFMNSLSNEQRQALESLLFDESLMLDEHDGKVILYLNVNDTFYYAADAEDVQLDDLPTLAYLFEHYDWQGLVAWVAKKRDMDPLEGKFTKTDEYYKAIEYLNNEDSD